jgi:voltage-gated potassium channel Kch
MSTFSFRDRLRYAFDNTMSKGTPALVFWLAMITLGLIGVHTTILLALGLVPEDASGEGAEGTIRVLWYGLMRAMDAGTLGGDAGGWQWPLLIANLGITLGGIFILSTLISILSSGLQTRLEELRKGKSRVLETGHVVILGWSPAIPTVLRQLALASESDGKGIVAILAQGDKAEMDDFVKEIVAEHPHLRVVVRSGNPSDRSDLELVNVYASRSVLVLHAGGGHDGDVTVIQTLMALFTPGKPKPLHVVAELCDHGNMEAAMLLGGDELQVVLGADLVSRIMVQALRQPGLSQVHAETLDFDGNEVYFSEPGELVGRTFGEVLFAFRASSLIGIYRGGKALLAPSMDTIVEAGDQLVVIAEDDSKVKIEWSTDKDLASIREGHTQVVEQERTLVLGWHSEAWRIIQGLDSYVGEGSEVCVVTPVVDAEVIASQVGHLQRQSLTVIRQDPTRRAVLEDLKPGAWTHILVLPPDATVSERADATVLLSLIHLRDLAQRRNLSISVVSEMLNVHNRDLAASGAPDDFIVSNQLVSLMMCQMAENPHLMPVLHELLDPDGAEYYVRPASLYVEPVEVQFSTIVEAARRRGEAAIGFRTASNGKVTLNPEKSQRVCLTDADSVVVVAHN